jgi:TPR repeat protein
MYANGQGVAKDEKTAVLWYTKAAKQGFANAQIYLGAMYADGRGVTQDIVSAHMWFYLAARAGDGAAVKRRDLTAAQMTPIQLSGAEDRAQRCINSNYKDCD